MRIIHVPTTDPYFNLATEEYLIDNSDEDIFMLWRNSPAVIIGRNQNAYAEINGQFVRENNIKVVRRLTGGGAVFHDLGNVNYTFIVGEERAAVLNFEKFCRPIIESLCKLGIEAELSGRNDILANGKKVSGTAQCVRNGKIMHHGCILYSADLSFVSGALKVNEEKMKSKGIKSVRSRVCNICDLLDGPMSVEEFVLHIENCTDGEKRNLSEEEITGIQFLADTKYSTWEWNYGKSKSFEKFVTKRFPFGTVTAGFTLESGMISEIEFEGDFFSEKNISELSGMLSGKRFDERLLSGIDIGKYIFGATEKDILDLLAE